ncbi:chorismate mutase [Arthrobacter agilis]|uniref:chorismate mutase n=1 Tax=Arthrobacter agilis TaxID=37921 RepID=UPI000B362B38|nr:chorismate mutase [Arthrobacter agilis]OUM45054.1 chorismate mutase [Arthrobacter agilis]PPB46880.1 chorismate mutase [Arthrobacter agilis]TPV23529.1 chorismate mutase [Arthrobacter agilis]WDF34663.1 chorismate mutase [Arthrobacter agilis]VDR31928.1 Salicylate biosynthesis protein pchB [Arthrobacter agilis]
MPGENEEQNAKQLAAVRVAINEVDEQIVSLIARRERLVRRAGALKRDDESVRAPARVEQVITNVRGYAERLGVDPTVVEHTYRAMISAFIDYELKVRRGH